MLIITRKKGQRVLLETSDGTVEIGVSDAVYGKVRLEIIAPSSVGIIREELARDCAYVIH